MQSFECRHIHWSLVHAFQASTTRLCQYYLSPHTRHVLQVSKGSEVIFSSVPTCVLVAMMQRFMLDSETPWVTQESFTCASSKSKYALNHDEEQGAVPAHLTVDALTSEVLHKLDGRRFVALLEAARLLKQPAKDVVQLLGGWARCFLCRGDTSAERHIMAWLVCLLCRR
jgi:hypothetical protein